MDDFAPDHPLSKCNDAILAIAKVADIGADWVIVYQLESGSFGSRPIAHAVALAFAVLGTAVELYAIGALWNTKFLLNAAEQVVKLKRTLLNRSLAWARFLTDDLPTFAVAVFLLAGPHPNDEKEPVAEGLRNEAGEIGGDNYAWGVVILSLSYSMYALIIHRCRPRALSDDGLLKQCQESGIGANDLKGLGLRKGALKDAGYEELREEENEHSGESRSTGGWRGLWKREYNSR
eukprot:CAMPEP_0119337152 /NCGR_PEP_ID=MMETSP1333-20130426/93372_1 /TAXON_ID=418940 /ORGANISM="Scyphosphaera apsteinii, Strain RCC1455" /LENGTH=233 /DNA_ID=CAMNT_0007348139 /DNA_START=268 /DNA_END=965 /DNA_ORIENTATION=-